MRTRLALAAALVLQLSVSAEAEELRDLRAEQSHALDKTDKLLLEKYQDREAEARARIRTIYKLTRKGWPRVWVVPGARTDVSRWLGAARRIAGRDQHELALLREELDWAKAAREHLQGQAAIPEGEIEHRSLVRPVKGAKIRKRFGSFKGPSHRVRLFRRGVVFEVEAGDEVRAVADGEVLHLGKVSGLGSCMISEHRALDVPLLSIICGVKAEVRRGQVVSAEQVVGTALGEELYLEIRRDNGDLGQAINPGRLLGR